MFALGAVLVGGCSTTYRQARPATVDQLRTLIDGDAIPREPGHFDRGRVTLLNQNGGEARSIALAPAAATGAHTAGEDFSPVDVSDLRGVEVKRPHRGAFDGLMWGIAAGAAAGAIAGATQGDDPPGELIGFTTREKVVGGALLFGGAGGLVGALIGRLLGHTDRYLF